MKIRRPVLKQDQEFVEIKKQKDQLGVATNVLQSKHNDLSNRLLEATKTCEIEEKRAEQLKLSNDQLETSIIAKREATVALDNEFKHKKSQNNDYEVTFKIKVANEIKRINEEIPELIFKHDVLIEKIQDLSDEADIEKDNLDALITQKSINIEENKVLQTKKDQLNSDILTHNATIVTKKQEIDTQNLTIQGNTNTIEYQKQVLSELSTSYEIGKDKIIENNVKISEQGRTIKENDTKMAKQAIEMSDHNELIMDINTRDKKLKNFAKTLEAKAKSLGIYIKLD